MDIQKLAELATKQINNNIDFLPLVLPQRKKQYDTYYMGKGKGNSPKGTYKGVVRGGELVHFDPIDVLAYCVALGAKVMIVTPNGDKFKGEDVLSAVQRNRADTDKIRKNRPIVLVDGTWVHSNDIEIIIDTPPELTITGDTPIRMLVWGSIPATTVKYLISERFMSQRVTVSKRPSGREVQKFKEIGGNS